MKSYLLLFFLLCMMTLPAFGVNLITNGNFELPGFSIPDYYRYLVNGDSTTMLGWTVSDDGIGEKSYLMHRTGYGSGVYEGLYTLSLNQGSSIQTTFATTLHAMYRLSFYMTMSAHPNATPMKVNIAGYTTTFATTGIQTYDFVATSTNANTILQFVNDGPTGDFKIHTLDAISVEVLIPEPTVWVMMLLGMVFWRGRKMA